MSRLPATPARRHPLKLLGGVASAAAVRAPCARRVRPAMRCRRAYSLRAGPADVALLGGTAPGHRGLGVQRQRARSDAPRAAGRHAARPGRQRPGRADHRALARTAHPECDGRRAALTQSPIAARGGTFDYAFACPDAGTFWYHPHLRGHVQVAMGLHGVLVVEEPVAPDVDRDVVWVLDDWRLTSAAQLRDDFDSVFDAIARGAARRHGHGERRRCRTGSR